MILSVLRWIWPSAKDVARSTPELARPGEPGVMPRASRSDRTRASASLLASLTNPICGLYQMVEKQRLAQGQPLQVEFRAIWVNIYKMNPGTPFSLG